jgi:hypothetical protein
MGDIGERVPLREIYERTLSEAGYSFDRFDIYGVGWSDRIQPLDFEGYDVVFWFTGPDLADNLIHEDVWKPLHRHVVDGGKAILAGDGLARYCDEIEYWGLMRWFYNFRWPFDFRSRYQNILGFEYFDEMPSGLECPYVYLEPDDEPLVGLSGIPITFHDAILVRGCPHARNMSWIKQDPRTAAPGFYHPFRDRGRKYRYWVHSQPIFYVKPETGCGMPEGAVGALYCEIGEAGQIVFFNFDLSAFPNDNTQACDGNVPDPSPDYLPGTYEGRVGIIGAILKHTFGLQPDE